MFVSSVLHTDRNSRWCRNSSKACKLRSRDAADDGVHAPLAWDVTPGEGQLGLAVGQRGLRTLALHLLNPVALFTDLCPQPGRDKRDMFMACHINILKTESLFFSIKARRQ